MGKLPVGDDRDEHARVVGASARDLEDAGAARAHGVDVRVRGGLDVEANAVALAEDVGGRAELDVVLDDLAGGRGLVRGERVPGADVVAAPVAPGAGLVDLAQAGSELPVGDPRAAPVRVHVG